MKRIFIILFILWCSASALATTISQTQNSSLQGFNGGRRHGELFSNFPVSTITSIQFAMIKIGSPTGTIYCRVRKVSDDSIIGTLGSMNVASLTETLAYYTFNSSSVVINEQQDIRICVEYSGGDADNKPLSYFITPQVYDGGVMTMYNGSSWSDYSAHDATWANLTYYIPAIDSLTLSYYGSSMNQGQYLCTPDYITITGILFTGATEVSFGSGITVSSFTVDSDTQITIKKMYISTTATTGARTCSVTTPSGTATKSSALTITNNRYYPFTGSGWGWVYNTVSAPVSWHYEGEHNRTYIVWQGPKSTTNNGDIYITYYDHDLAESGANPWGDHVKVAVTPSYKTYVQYDSVPSICISSDGHIIVGYAGTRSTYPQVPAVYVKRSSNAEDISTWGEQLGVDYGYYQNFVKSDNGDIYYIYQRLFMQESTNYLTLYSYKKSTDGGANWGSSVDFINFSDDGTPDDQVFGIWKYDSANNRIIGAFCQWDNVGESTTRAHDLWCVAINCADGKVQDAAGGYNSTTALSHANAMSGSYKFLVKDTTVNEGTYTPAIEIDENGTIHIVCPIWDLSDSEAHLYTQSYQMYTYWTGSAWSSLQTISTVTPMSQPAIEVISASPLSLNVYCTDINKDMARYHFNGATWDANGALFDLTADVDNADSYAQDAYISVERYSGSPMVFCEVDYTDYTRRRRAYAYFLPFIKTINGTVFDSIKSVNGVNPYHVRAFK